MNDGKLWKVFSMYIRIRDADPEGYCRCITCGRVKRWNEMDCGHGIPRQHKSTKFHEHNNHAQCKRCNAFEGGMREVYKEKINKMYGEQTWEKLEVMSRQVCKRGKFEIETLAKYYKDKVNELKKLKNIT